MEFKCAHKSFHTTLMFLEPTYLTLSTLGIGVPTQMLSKSVYNTECYES